jgi:hypothetical protein
VAWPGACSSKEIALRLGRDPSVISRDVARHGAAAGIGRRPRTRRRARPGSGRSCARSSGPRGCGLWCVVSCVVAGHRPRSRAGCPSTTPNLAADRDQGGREFSRTIAQGKLPGLTSPNVGEGGRSRRTGTTRKSALSGDRRAPKMGPSLPVRVDRSAPGPSQNVASAVDVTGSELDLRRGKGRLRRPLSCGCSYT